MSQIYLVTGQRQLFDNETYKIISVEESLRLLDTFNMIQFDTETKGKDCHIAGSYTPLTLPTASLV